MKDMKDMKMSKPKPFADLAGDLLFMPFMHFMVALGFRVTCADG